MLSASPSIEVGQPFPEIHLPNMETGELEALSKYRGKRLLLIHFASW
jgi:peroxiredoxin